MTEIWQRSATQLLDGFASGGVPVTIKDSIAIAGWPYWRSTKGRIGTTPYEDSPPAARLKEAGAIIFGKTTMPDYGLLPSRVSSAHGTTRDLSMNTGGSSSGAGAAVASDILALAAWYEQERGFDPGFPVI